MLKRSFCGRPIYVVSRPSCVINIYLVDFVAYPVDSVAYLVDPVEATFRAQLT